MFEPKGLYCNMFDPFHLTKKSANVEKSMFASSNVDTG